MEQWMEVICSININLYNTKNLEHVISHNLRLSHVFYKRDYIMMEILDKEI